MTKNSQIDNNDINLIELAQIVWEGKWKIAVVVIISFIAAITVIINQSKQTKIFTNTTEIRSIGKSAINKYILINNSIGFTGTSFQFQTITESTLLNLYIDVMQNKSVFEDAIRKFNLLEASQYNNDREYSEAITRLASSIKILSPKQKGLETTYHTINFANADVKKWKSVLIHADKLANKLVKQSLVEDFNVRLSVFQRSNEFKIENLKKIQNHNLEDLKIKINNSLDDYDRDTFDRLEYLKEQAQLAEELGIENSTIVPQAFNSPNGIITNINTNSPFYLRGNKVINKEIDLTTNRLNKNAFIKGLVELEKNKRAIDQDKTIERIEKDKSLDLLKEIMQLSPLGDNNDFYAASANVFATKTEYKDKNNVKTLLLVIISGLIAGIFYVLFSNALQSDRDSRKKTN